ncbi:MAG: DMT family transporter [Acidimicrobiales bacterium]
MATSLAAAFLFAVASVLQHRSAAQEPAEHSMRISLITRLIRQPAWLVGMAADVGAYVLQFVALGHGSLILVQPLLVAGLLFALPMSAALFRRRLAVAEWVGAAGTVAGLAVFLVAAYPGPGHPEASLLSWVEILVAILVPSTVLVVFAGPSPSTRRAVMLGSATGLVFGLTAALTKAVAHLLSLGIVHLLLGWQTYVLVVVGIASMVVAQSAFQAGPLRASLPILTVLDPVVSIVIGALAFGEALGSGPARRAGEVLGLVLLTLSVALLTRSGPIGPEWVPGGQHREQVEPGDATA